MTDLFMPHNHVHRQRVVSACGCCFNYISIFCCCLAFTLRGLFPLGNLFPYPMFCFMSVFTDFIL